MSEPMKKRHTENIEITIKRGKKNKLYLVPSSKAEGIECLIREYELGDFVPADSVLQEYVQKNGGKNASVLRGLRLRDNITQLELAQKIGLPQSWISGWENGTRALGKKNAEKLADFFNTDYRIFL